MIFAAILVAGLGAYASQWLSSLHELAPQISTALCGCIAGTIASIAGCSVAVPMFGFVSDASETEKHLLGLIAMILEPWLQPSILLMAAIGGGIAGYFSSLLESSIAISLSNAVFATLVGFGAGMTGPDEKK